MVLKRLVQISDIGSFSEFKSPNDASLDFEKFNIILGHNGDGKSTVTAILDSLNQNNSNLIMQKKRINCVDSEPYSIIDFINDDAFIFKEGFWKLKGNFLMQPTNKFIIFDEEYVSKNFFAQRFEHQHKVNLHNIIFGSEGIEINENIKKTQAKLENIKSKIGLSTLLEVKQHLNLNIDCLLETKEKFKENEEKIKFIQSQEEILKKDNFESLDVIDFSFDKLIHLLKVEINSESHLKAKEEVLKFKENYFSKPELYEKFIELGVQNIKDKYCPFCQKQLESEEILDIYRNFFDKAFEEHKLELKSNCTTFINFNLDSSISILKKKLENNLNLEQYWAEKITNLDNCTSIDFFKLSSLKKSVSEKINEKKENIGIEFNISELEEFKKELKLIVDLINEYNIFIEKNIKKNIEFKQQLEKLNLSSFQLEQQKLKKIINRFETNEEDYEQFEKTESELGIIQKQLTDYTIRMAETYLESMNEKLVNLGLRNLRLKSIASKKTGTAKDSNVEIILDLENHEIDMKSHSETEPAFNNTLSNGEKNALSFAFFLTQLDNTINLDEKILIFDDPLNSLDNVRKRNIVLEIKSFKNKTSQIIVLTHKDSFFKILHKENEESKTFLLEKDSTNGSLLKKLDIKEYLKDSFRKTMEKLERYSTTNFDYPNLENDIRKVFEKIISTKYYLEVKQTEGTIVKYNTFNNLFWSKGKLLDKKDRITSICNLSNENSHSDISHNTVYDNLSYAEKKDIVLEVLDIIKLI